MDRLCGEAVLRGADVFCAGVRGASRTLQRGQRVRVLADVGAGKGGPNASLPRGADPSCFHRDALVAVADGVAAVARREMLRLRRGLGVRVVGGVGAGRLRAPPLNGLLPGLPVERFSERSKTY